MKSREKLLGIIAIILAVAVLLGIYFLGTKSKDESTAPKKITNTENESNQSPKEANAHIVLTVIGKDGNSVNYEIATDAKYLADAMKDAEGLTFSGTEGPYGLMLESVNGERAIYEKDHAYWSILVDGEYGMYGIDSQPVRDGVTYSLVYTAA